MIANHNHLVFKRTLNHVAKLAKWLNCVVSTYLYVAFYIMSCKSFRVNPHAIVCLNVKELLAWSRCHIWGLSDSNVIWIHNYLVPKRTLNHLAKLVKWLGCVLSTYLYGAFDCIVLSGHEFQSESTFYSLPVCQGTPCLKQRPYLKFKWQQHVVSTVLWSWFSNVSNFVYGLR